jgi:hypothetical protein
MLVDEVAAHAASRSVGAFSIISPGYPLPMSTKLTDALPTQKEPTKAELYAEAARLGVEGRSKMNKRALATAVKRRREKLQVMQPRA